MINNLLKHFIKKVKEYIYYTIGNIRAISLGVQIGNGAKISPKANIGSAYYIGKATIGRNVTMGKGSYINSGEIFAANIGNWCSIGYDVLIGPTEHDLTAPTTSPSKAISLGLDPNITTKKELPPIISDEVWIGAGVIILAGTKIGAKAVIAAGAVVTKDVPENESWGGIPAKFIKNREQ